jgi:hypothetical protein
MFERPRRAVWMAFARVVVLLLSVIAGVVCPPYESVNVPLAVGVSGAT